MRILNDVSGLRAGLSKRLVASAAGVILTLGTVAATAPPAMAASCNSSSGVITVTLDDTTASYSFALATTPNTNGPNIELNVSAASCGFGSMSLVLDGTPIVTQISFVTGGDQSSSVTNQNITVNTNSIVWNGAYLINLGGGNNDVFTLAGGPNNDNLDALSVTVQDSGLDTLVLSGNEGDDTLTSYGRNDTLLGGGGNDTLIGNSGNDLIEGGPGSDTMDGGFGTDTLSYASSLSGVTVTLNGAASGGDADTDTSINFEALEGSANVDHLNGTSANDVISGLAGDDVITGGRGSDVLNGGADSDELNGNGGNDNISGGSGADTLLYGGGVDAFYGGDSGNTDTDSCEGWVAGTTNGSTGTKKYGRVTYWYCDQGI